MIWACEGLFVGSPATLITGDPGGCVAPDLLLLSLLVDDERLAAVLHPLTLGLLVEFMFMFTSLDSDRGTARFASTFLASIVCGSFANVLSTELISVKVIKPNPRDRRETGSFITTASCTVPYTLKYFRNLSKNDCTG